MSNAIPRKRLQDFCQIEIGGTPSRGVPEFWAEQGKGHPWVAISDLGPRHITSTAEQITDSAIPRSNVKAVPRGTVLMSFKLTLGRMGIAGTDLFTNEAIAAFYPDTSQALPEWLYYALPEAVSTAQFDTAVKGATLNKEKLRNLMVLLPTTVVEQEGIANVLSALDEQLEATESLIEKLTQRRKGLVQEHLLPAATSASTVALGDVCSVITSGSRGWAQYYAPEGDLFLRIGNLTRAHPNLRFDDVVFVNPPAAGEGQRTRLEAGDVLISITADLGIIGCIPESFGTAYINQHIALARLSDADLDPRWVAHVLASPFGSEQISKLNDGGAKAGLNLTTINALRVPKPSLETQKELAALLDAADEEIASEQALAVKLHLQKQGLMRDLLTGKTRVLQ